MKQSNLYRWVKASERLPEKGFNNTVIIKGNDLPKDEFGHGIKGKFVTTGFVNFDKEYPKFYFLFGNDSFLSNETIEWLEEIEPVQEVNESAENVVRTIINSGCSFDKKVELVELFANQFKGSVQVSEEEKNVYREQGWDACEKRYLQIDNALNGAPPANTPGKTHYLNSFIK